MASRSQSVPAQPLPTEVPGAAPRSREAWDILAFSPMFLLAGAIHLLCRPRTRLFFLGVVILDVPLQWGEHLSLVPGADALGALDGFDISVTTLSLVALYIGWVFTSRVETRPIRIAWNWPIASYTAIVVVSLLVSTDLRLSLFQAFLIVEMLFLFLYCASNIKSRSDILFVLRIILIGGIIEGAYMLALVAFGREPSIVRLLGFKTVIYEPLMTGEVRRYGGTVGSPNYAAAYLAIVITLALAVWQMDVPARLRRLAIPALVVAAPALLITLSRGGMLELMLSVAMFFAMTWLRKGLSTGRLMVFGMAVALLIASLYFPNPISRRLIGNDGGSAYSRIPLMHLAENVITANPILGVGANNFSAVMRSYEGPEFRHAWEYTVHNEFLLVWAETGALGLAAYLLIFGGIIRKGWRLWKQRDELFAPLGLGIVAAICGLLAHMFVDVFSGRALIQFVWILAALLAACDVVRRNELAAQRNLWESEVEAV